jgi:hypothetical protein
MLQGPAAAAQRATDQAITTSNLRRVASFQSASEPGLSFLALAPLMSWSRYTFTTSHPMLSIDKSKGS